MIKNDVLLWGMILQADIYVDGHGTTEEDESLLRKALWKVYGVTTETTEEEINRINQIMEEDTKKLTAGYRQMIVDFVES